MSDVAKVPGSPITILGVEYTLAPVPLIKMPEVQPLLKGGNFMTDASYTSALVSGIFFGLRRNHPQVTREMVEDNLDNTTLKPWMHAFLEANGMQSGGTGSGETPAN